MEGSVWTEGTLNLGSLGDGQSYLIEGAAYVPNPDDYSAEDKAKVKEGIHQLPIPPGVVIPPLDFSIPILSAPEPDPILPALKIMAIAEGEGHYFNSSQTIDLSAGTWNGIYYVEGDLELTCSTGEYSGQAVFVAGGKLCPPKKPGDISIPKNTLISFRNKGDFLGLIAKNNISFGQNNTVKAYLWAGETVELSKNTNLQGYIICHEFDASKECTIGE